MGRPDPNADRLDSLAYSMLRYRDIESILDLDPAKIADNVQIEGWRHRAKAALTMLLGPWPVEMVASEPTWGEAKARPGHSRRSVTFRTRPGMAAFGYLLVPDGAKPSGPAMLCVPGHGRGVDDIVGIDETGADRDHDDGYQHDFAVQCVRKGYVTLALEPLGFGHRRDPASREAGASQSSCQPAAGAALLLGETMVGWRVWDAMRAVDLLTTLPEVDPHRIGMMGISGGGTVTYFTTAFDPRIKAAVISGYFCTAKDSIFSIAHCIDNYIPNFLHWFETADLAALIAPRHLFVEAGLHDPIFPEAGVRAALTKAKAIYASLGVADHIDNAFFDGAHVFDGKAAFDRLAAWL